MEIFKFIQNWECIFFWCDNRLFRNYRRWYFCQNFCLSLQILKIIIPFLKYLFYWFIIRVLSSSFNNFVIIKSRWWEYTLALMINSFLFHKLRLYGWHFALVYYIYRRFTVLQSLFLFALSIHHYWMISRNFQIFNHSVISSWSYIRSLCKQTVISSTIL